MGDAKPFSIDFRANPVQHRFITSQAEADLFAARMGEGKSAALCWASFHHARQNPGATHAFIRDTWENLRDTTQKEFFSWFPPGVVGEYHASKKTFTWNLDGIEGEVMFIGMDDAKDASKLQSRSLGAMFIDEPAPAAESGGIDEMIFTTGMSRLRQKRMNWYAAKLATNNPDESHWTYRTFVDPGTEGYKTWQTAEPENNQNLPDGYYDRIRKAWAHRPDLIRRFADGKYGFQRIGMPMTPEWNDDFHLADSLEPIDGKPLYLLWDFGLTPVCIFTQTDTLGAWNILQAFAVEDMGAYELISTLIKPTLALEYPVVDLYHIGDPAGAKRSEADARQSAAAVIKRELGGRWRAGPSSIADRVDPLRWALTQARAGKGMVRVDRQKAKHVWFALRGGWHRHMARTGVVSDTPVKSHPDSDIGDAMGYGAAILYPHGQVRRSKGRKAHDGPRHFAGSTFRRGLGFEKPGATLPKAVMETPIDKQARVLPKEEPWR